MSPAHKPFQLHEDIAEKFGYLKLSDDSDTTSKPTVFGTLSRHKLRSSELGPCKRTNCACPRFKFTPPQGIITSAVADLDLFTSLDGAAGSTLHGHRADEGDDPENITLSYDKPLPDIMPEGDEEPYVRPPDSSDEEEVKWQKGFPQKPPRICEDRIEMRKRFGKGKNKKIKRTMRREENIPNSEKYSRPISKPAERRVLDAYAAADEKLFGQKRFEELEDDIVVQQEAVANWQEEIGMKAVLDDDPREAADQLSQDIDFFIRDVLSEVRTQAERAEQERRDKIYNNKLTFEDTLEDVVIDHELSLAEQDQERFRKTAGKEQNKKLRDLKTEDTVDDIAMDHNQEVVEKQEEHHRKVVGRIQNKELAGIRTGDMVDSLAMDHLQEVHEKEQEHHRKTVGIIQNRKLTGIKMDDAVDNVAMDHLQGVHEEEQEHHRKTVGIIQNRKLTAIKMDDAVDSVTMDHLQEVYEEEQEHHRKTTGRTQNKKLTGIRASDMVDSLAMDHLQEVHEKEQEHHRKTVGIIQNRGLAGIKMDDAVDNVTMDHLQEVYEEEQEHHRKTIGRTQNKQLTDVRMDDTVDVLVINHAQEIGQKEQEYRRKSTGRPRNRELANIDNLVMGHLHKVGEKVQVNHRKTSGVRGTKKFKHGRETGFVVSLGVDHLQEVNGEAQDHRIKNSGIQPTKRLKLGDRREASLYEPLDKPRHEDVDFKETIGTKNQVGKKGGELWYGQGGRTIQDNLTIQSIHLDHSRPAEANRQTATNHEAFGPEQSASSIIPRPEVEFRNNQDDSDGYSSPAPAPKKDRRQLRKEANAKFEAMMDEMLGVQKA
ncbi:hypothetical protein Q9L58_004700 [Maublancomyces gigas]|uniref:Uncharacterized protein n=1 Tax=Discina gigas TaxID=1032678 RepID=A0ABR3GKF7_9PEZI